MTTLTAYPRLLEPNVPPPGTVIGALRDLAERIGPDRVIWRYDPVFLSTLTDGEFHRRTFGSLAEALKGSVRRVIISLYDEYGGTRRRISALEKAGSLKTLPLYAAAEALQSTAAESAEGLTPQIRELLPALAQAAAGAEMTIQSCAERDLRSLNIAAGACIDGDLIRNLWGIETGGRDKNQRPRCRCASSVDIGSYGPCPAGCVYCYALR
jgi:DNA repair photolyase